MTIDILSSPPRTRLSGSQALRLSGSQALRLSGSQATLLVLIFYAQPRAKAMRIRKIENRT
ncbi:MAG: hypothetical protein DDT34_01473 [Firmicutes bacterium]|nr:hypothetical protein [Bacillota bacterium]